MSERKINITEDQYVVHEKLIPGAYKFATPAHRLAGAAKKVHDAGIKMEFYAYIPQVESSEEKLLKRKFELDGEISEDKKIPPAFSNALYAIDGVYLISNLKSSDGKLKVVTTNERGSTTLKEIDDSWVIHLDPSTAEMMNLNQGEVPTNSTSTISDEIVQQIQDARTLMGLNKLQIESKIAERANRTKIR